MNIENYIDCKSKYFLLQIMAWEQSYAIDINYTPIKYISIIRHATFTIEQ